MTEDYFAYSYAHHFNLSISDFRVLMESFGPESYEVQEHKANYDAFREKAEVIADKILEDKALILLIKLSTLLDDIQPYQKETSK